jgi:hypothetical protein
VQSELIFKGVAHSCTAKGARGGQPVTGLAFTGPPLTAAYSVLLAASFSRSSLHSISLRSLTSAHAHYVWVIGHNTESTHITTNFTHYIARLTSLHSLSFRPLSFQQPTVHRLHLLCSPALSFGLRAVTLFAFSPCWPTLDQLLSTTNRTKAKKHASPCSCGHSAQIRLTFHAAFLIVRTAFLRQAPCSHPTSCSRTHSAKRFVRLGGSQLTKLHAVIVENILFWHSKSRQLVWSECLN